MTSQKLVNIRLLRIHLNVDLRAETGHAMNLKPAEIVRCHQSLAGSSSAVKNNVLANENEGNPGKDGSNANEEQREGTAEHRHGCAQVFRTHNRIKV